VLKTTRSLTDLIATFEFEKAAPMGGFFILIVVPIISQYQVLVVDISAALAFSLLRVVNKGRALDDGFHEVAPQVIADI